MNLPTNVTRYIEEDWNLGLTNTAGLTSTLRWAGPSAQVGRVTLHGPNDAYWIAFQYLNVRVGPYFPDSRVWVPLKYPPGFGKGTSLQVEVGRIDSSGAMMPAGAGLDPIRVSLTMLYTTPVNVEPK